MKNQNIGPAKIKYLHDMYLKDQQKNIYFFVPVANIFFNAAATENFIFLYRYRSIHNKAPIKNLP
jgi:hypothetical protein